MRFRESGEAVADGLAVSCRQQSLPFEHAGVRDRAFDVVCDEPGVEPMVFPGRESEYSLVEGQTLVP
jgi:hypothetical protein